MQGSTKKMPEKKAFVIEKCCFRCMQGCDFFLCALWAAAALSPSVILAFSAVILVDYTLILTIGVHC
jgi:hypothetical protein